jgi:sulfatase maturation enzyme AslB (radical SAM superfamily)
VFSDEMKHGELSLLDIQRILPREFVQQLDKMFMCGNFGDPAAAKDTLQIFKWFREVNPTITLGLNTNGGLRSTRWWTELASILNGPRDFVVFSIDGLKDTNHIYRIGVNWNKLVANARAFIGAGGNAQWDMLIYQHNEHQLHEAIEFARAQKFSWFRSKVTRRPINVSFLALPSLSKPHTNSSTTIDCFALKEQSIYMGSLGTFYPCCFIAGDDYKQSSGVPFGQISTEFNSITQTWDSNPRRECQKTCSGSNVTAFSNQWKTELCLS